MFAVKILIEISSMQLKFRLIRCPPPLSIIKLFLMWIIIFYSPLSYLNFVIQPKNSKQAKSGQARISKVAPSVSVNMQHVQANSKPRTNKGTAKAGSKPVELSTGLDTDVTVRLCSINEGTMDNQRPSQQEICTKKGLPPILPTIRTTFLYEWFTGPRGILYLLSVSLKAWFMFSASQKHNRTCYKINFTSFVNASSVIGKIGWWRD